MDSVGPVTNSPEKVKPSPPSLTKRGLELQKKIGANPYKFGVIGSSDNHTALPASAEDFQASLVFKS